MIKSVLSNITQAFFAAAVSAPAEEYLARIDNPNAMRAAIDAIPGLERSLETYLKDTVLAKDSTLQMKSILTLQKTFDNYLNKYRMIGGLLVLVLAFIGVMNFFNTTATSILGRRRELALLEAVGMTKRQIQKMLIAEGFVYLAELLK